MLKVEYSCNIPTSQDNTAVRCGINLCLFQRVSDGNTNKCNAVLKCLEKNTSYWNGCLLNKHLTSVAFDTYKSGKFHNAEKLSK